MNCRHRSGLSNIDASILALANRCPPSFSPFLEFILANFSRSVNAVWNVGLEENSLSGCSDASRAR